MELDTEVRRDLADRLVRVLEQGCAGSRVALRGSLDRGTADRFSDIDLEWTVPDAEFARCADAVGELLCGAAPVNWLRSAPEYQRACGHRLLFVWFEGVPLFWRLDLEMWAESAVGHPEEDVEPGTDWSLQASALANAVATIKAVRRGRPDVARGLIERGFARIGSTQTASGNWAEDVHALARAAGAQDEAVAELADQVDKLVNLSGLPGIVAQQAQ